MKLSFGICAGLATACMMSLLACTPLDPKKVLIGSTVLSQLGVIGYWSFDETTFGSAPGGADFADLTGNGNHGRASGSVTLATVGIKNTAVSAYGSGAITIPIDLSAQKVVTLSIWVNPHISMTQASNVLFEYTQNSSTSNGFFAGLDDNTGSPAHAFLLWLHGTAGFFGRSTPTLNSTWHNILATYDRSNPSQNSITLTIDGALVNTSVYGTDTANNSGNFDPSHLYLFCRGGTTLCLSADIDELVIWNRAVSFSEASSLYSIYEN